MPSARSELGRGGRIASLVSSSGQEWLWHRARASERDGLGPSPNFVDIGGVDECIRTISGTPDHGAMWTKVGEGSDEDAVASTDEFVLHRRIISADAPVLNSHLVAEPGHRLLLAGTPPPSSNPAGAMASPRGGDAVPARPVEEGETVTMRWPVVLGRKGCDPQGNRRRVRIVLPTGRPWRV